MSPAARPELSVIVASHNRRELLRRCLGSLAHQDLEPERFEVIVADDGSDDGTAEMLRELDTPYALRALSLAKAGKAAALNVALREAQGDVYLFLDDDVIASPQLVSEHLAAHRRDPDTLAIGKLIQVPPRARDWYARSFSRHWESHYAALSRRQARWCDCWGGNFSFPRSIALAVGGFVTDLPAVEDTEIGLRLHRAGCTPRYLPEAQGVHDDQKRWRRMLADADAQGAAYVELVRRFPEAEADLQRWAVLRWSAAIGPAELALRRLLIALRLPPVPLVWAGALLRDRSRQENLMEVIRRLALWQGARRAMSRTEWAAVTGGARIAEGG